MTTKMLAKAEKKREREEARAALEAEREAKREAREKREEEIRKRTEDREAAREAEERRVLEERQKKAEEELLQWKDSFTVEEEGEDQEAEDENTLEQFVEHIQKKKVVVLEELAGEFGMKTQDAIDRVTKLEAMGRITGVIDDRGKFVFITPEEMSKVARFITRRGRVSQAELAAESNKLVDLTEEK